MFCTFQYDFATFERGGRLRRRRDPHLRGLPHLERSHHSADRQGGQLQHASTHVRACQTCQAEQRIPGHPQRIRGVRQLFALHKRFAASVLHPNQGGGVPALCAGPRCRSDCPAPRDARKHDAVGHGHPNGPRIVRFRRHRAGALVPRACGAARRRIALL